MNQISLYGHSANRSLVHLYRGYGVSEPFSTFYIPLTVALIRRVGTVEGEYARLAEFFQFKKCMDWIGVPVSRAIIVPVTFTLFVKGGVEGNPRASLAFFALWVGMSLIAAQAENRKRFVPASGAGPR